LASINISLVGYAILSLLAKIPLSGYDIVREIKKPHSFFYGQVQFSQVYPELARLRASELVTSRIIEQQGKPDKRVYTISPLGLQVLKSWVVAPTPIVETRSEFLIKAHSLWLSNPQQAIIQFREHERYHREQLAAYQASLEEIEQRWGSSIRFVNTPAFGDYLTVTRGISYEREYIAWLQWVIAILEERISLLQGPDLSRPTKEA
jgi:DNA-binding PadR family transcriptional regulator